MDGIKVKKTVWGEIQISPFNASKLLSPREDENNTKDKRNVQRETPSSDTISLAMEDEQDFNYDPIGSRLIELRHYHIYLLRHLRHRKERLEKKNSKGRRQFMRYCVLPAFPENYPFRTRLGKTSSDTQKMIKCSGEMTENVLENKRKRFIRRVITQVGFIEQEDDVVDVLSTIVDDYLRKFVTVLSHKKNSEVFSKNKDLWDAFEATLRKFGIWGVTALHAFYFENVIKKHDTLEETCNDLFVQLNKI